MVCRHFATGTGAVGALPYSGFHRMRPGLRVRGGFGVVDFNLRNRYRFGGFLMALRLFLPGLRFLLPGGGLPDLRFLLCALQHLSGRGATRT